MIDLDAYDEPDDLLRVIAIRKLRKEGLSMAEVVKRLSKDKPHFHPPAKPSLKT